MKKITQEEFDALPQEEKEARWMKALKKTTEENWERTFDKLNTLEARGVGIPQELMLEIKHRYQVSINKFFKTLIKYLIKNVKEHALQRPNSKKRKGSGKKSQVGCK